MADTSNPEIAQAVADVVNDKCPTTWIVLGFEGKTPKVLVQAKGEDAEPLPAIRAVFKEDECQFAYCKVTTGDEESKRSKFVFISWVGEKVSPLRKAKMSVQKADIKQVVRVFAYEMHATTPDDLDPARIMAAVIKAGGANYGTGAARE